MSRLAPPRLRDIQALALKPGGIQCYAHSVIRSEIFQLTRRDEPDRYLHLIAFNLGLRNADIRITLIDKHDYHTFQPLLYQVATLELTPEQVGFPIRDVLHHHQNVTFHQAVVTSIDTAGRE
jgi:hypothetical protein